MALLSSVLGQPPPLEQDSKISYDLNDVNFILWTPEFGLHQPLPFYANTAAIDLVKHSFKPNRPTKILAHGWTSAGLEYGDDFAEGKIPKLTKLVFKMSIHVTSFSNISYCINCE